MGMSIRSYHPADLSSLYRICLLTFDNGQDGSHLFSDPDLPGHYYAAPYAVMEPDLCFVLTRHHQPCGYVLGTRESATFYERCERAWFPPLRQRYPLPDADDGTARGWMIRLIHEGHKPDADAAGYPGHLHIDILPEGQGQGMGRRLIETFLGRLRALSVTAVHLGVGKQNLRAIGFYNKIGFHLIKERPGSLLLGMKLDNKKV